MPYADAFDDASSSSDASPADAAFFFADLFIFAYLFLLLLLLLRRYFSVVTATLVSFSTISEDYFRLLCRRLRSFLLFSFL